MAKKKGFIKTAKAKATQAGDYLGEKATEAKDKAIHTGEFLGDKAIETRDKATDAVKDGSSYVADKAIQAKRDHDLQKFRPLTESQLVTAMKRKPEMIHIVDWDKRKEETACKNAVAFNDGTNEIDVISVLTKKAKLTRASFYPDIKEGVYYRDPCDPMLYINLNDYFDYLKKARVHELNQIAQDLGATHIKISLKAEKRSFTHRKGKIGAAASKNQRINISISGSHKNLVSLEVASEKEFKGHEAQMPELNYFKNEPDILNVIRRRLDKNNPIQSDKETFRYSNSSGIKKDDAVIIEGVLKKFKISGGASIVDVVEHEERLLFEYLIEYPKVK